MTYKDRAWCSNSQFCTEECDRRLTERDREICKDGVTYVSFSDFTQDDICTNEKYTKKDVKDE